MSWFSNAGNSRRDSNANIKAKPKSFRNSLLREGDWRSRKVTRNGRNAIAHEYSQSGQKEGD